MTPQTVLQTVNVLKRFRITFLLAIFVVTAIVASVYLHFHGKTKQTQIVGTIIVITLSSLSAIHDLERIGPSKTPARWIAAKYIGVDILFVLSRSPNWSLISDLGFCVSSVICVIALGFIFMNSVSGRSSESTSDEQKRTI